MCVQRFDDSRNSAIHITYRISLRSSSMREPRDPLLKVLKLFSTKRNLVLTELVKIKNICLCLHPLGELPPERELSPNEQKNSSKVNSTVCSN